MIKLSLISLALVTTVSGSVFAAGKAKDAKPAAGKAGECSFEVDGTDAMKFVDAKGADLKEISIPEKCRKQDITFTLKHVGKLPKEAMGHNLVIHDLSKQQAIVADGMKAGPAVGYAPATKDGVLGHTDTIGGGAESKIVIAKGSFKDGTNYGFVCTFPGHSAIMNGKITFAK